MDTVIFVENIKKVCMLRGVKPTNACKESGVGGSFVNDIQRGRIPSVERVQQLALYLGVTVSELIGEVAPGETKRPPPGGGDELTTEARELLRTFGELNEEGQGVLLGVARSLTLSGQYIKNDAPGMVSGT